ncbi:MAG: flagellar basal body P-ring protein FlgI [Acidobacteria bacterium]|nr:flagellar basal body P-ring protein FlgI [Acidobacteriota bacterium]
MTKTTRVAVLAAAVIGMALGEAIVAAGESRLKDVATLQGVTTEPLVGYGLVVGLNKTGDKRQTLFSTQSLANMLSRFGIEVPGDQLKVENIAAVVVTGELSSYQRTGARVDVVASSIGDARSLQGGTLLPTALRDRSGAPVALAQGPLSIGGFGGGTGGSSVQVNHLTVGRIPGGAIVQTAAVPTAMVADVLTFSLRDPDFTTATYVAQAINAHVGSVIARPLDPGTIRVAVPDRFRQALPEFVAELEVLPVRTEVVARVVINERTGTVVVGGNVRLGAAAVAHGNLSVRITTRYQVSQPSAFSSGDTVVVPNEKVELQEGRAKIVALEEGVTLEAVTNALNSLGASPRDIIAILQALKAAGALHAEIVTL